MLAEVYLYDTCNLSCGYCNLAEDGLVADVEQLARFRDKTLLEQAVSYFSRHRSPEGWHLFLTGGEPLLLPNFDYFCNALAVQGHRISLYTNLSVPPGNPAYRYLLEAPTRSFGFLMASLHPQADEDTFFSRIEELKAKGHRVIVRFVGHPRRLDELPRLAALCSTLDLAFYPTPLYSPLYPARYTQREREELSVHFSSLSQIIQLNGGLDVSGRRCLAGSRLIYVDLQSGRVTPCISLSTPVIGNVYEGTLKLTQGTTACLRPVKVCSCDIHFQQGVVEGALDVEAFESQKQGAVAFLGLDEQEERVRSLGLGFAEPEESQGVRGDQNRLAFDRREVLRRLKRSRSSPSATCRRLLSGLLPRWGLPPWQSRTSRGR